MGSSALPSFCGPCDVDGSLSSTTSGDTTVSGDGAWLPSALVRENRIQLPIVIACEYKSIEFEMILRNMHDISQ